MPKVYIANLQRIIRIPKELVAKAISTTLKSENAADGTLSVAFVNDSNIRKLNKKFLKHDYATDVIAFKLGDELLGEVVISTQTAIREAKKRGISTKEEILRYCIHGTLHILGYNDKRPKDKTIMWAKQEKIIKRLKIADYLPRKIGADIFG